MTTGYLLVTGYWLVPQCYCWRRHCARDRLWENWEVVRVLSICACVSVRLQVTSRTRSQRISRSCVRAATACRWRSSRRSSRRRRISSRRTLACRASPTRNTRRPTKCSVCAAEDTRYSAPILDIRITRIFLASAYFRVRVHFARALVSVDTCKGSSNVTTSSTAEAAGEFCWSIGQLLVFGSWRALAYQWSEITGKSADAAGGVCCFHGELNAQEHTSTRTHEDTTASTCLCA